MLTGSPPLSTTLMKWNQERWALRTTELAIVNVYLRFFGRKLIRRKPELSSQKSQPRGVARQQLSPVTPILLKKRVSHLPITKQEAEQPSRLTDGLTKKSEKISDQTALTLPCAQGSSPSF
ncbi:hypothetical protein PGT21_023566 [Puccinia graminis f. sp. tritici]|uniref:Uncharacterized protein n=1 Tax=Puccinia graminis f. sp. tritici TaxID=56615 RepID=A0A5B0QNK0_PUCGR|nr:hypothetical protein PGT21_023566 [Puccinia graminis f. sp. tritici]